MREIANVFVVSARNRTTSADRGVKWRDIENRAMISWAICQGSHPNLDHITKPCSVLLVAFLILSYLIFRNKKSIYSTHNILS